MGNDGGSIPKRRELVKEAARNPTTSELKESLQEKQEYLWTTCPLSNTPLHEPIVSDSTGRLFNKDAVIELLIKPEEERGEVEKGVAATIKSLKDVVEVKFKTEEGSGTKESSGSGGIAVKWVCPITGKTLGPGSKAVYIVPCGHTFSGAAVKELAEEACQTCGETYAPNDVIPIIPTTEDDVARLLLRTKTLREKGLTHALKKAPGQKKRKKNGDTEEKTVAVEKVKASTNEAGRVSSGIKNTATASLTAKVLEEQVARNKKRKMEASDSVQSLFSTKDSSKPSSKNADFMSRGFTIPAGAKR